MVVTFRVLRPRRPPYAQEVMNQVAAEADRVAQEIKQEYEGTVKTWDEKPEFTITRDIDQDFVRVTVGATGPNAQLYAGVDKGTGRHLILPHGEYPLTFRSGYHRKTHVGSMESVPGGWRTGRWVRRGAVIHPGTKARGFTKRLAEKYQPGFAHRIYNAIRRGLRQANARSR